MRLGSMSDQVYRPTSKIKIVLFSLLGLAGAVILTRWLWWFLIVPMPIHDWQEQEKEITSPSHSGVILSKVATWDIEGKVYQCVPISDPILPTIGKFPRSIISPVDLFLAYGKLTEEPYFRQIRTTHEFRTANSHFDVSTPEGRTVRSWLSQGPDAPGGVLHEHTIPANYVIFQKLRKLKKGDLIKIKGSIVDIRDGDNIYTTSTVKNDRACEFLYITELEIAESE